MVNSSIGIVGTGAVAQALGRLLCDGGQPVVAVASRAPSNGARAAAFIGHGVRAVSCAELPELAGRVLVATSDEGIAATAETLARGGFSDGIALHTCGAKGPRALEPLQQAGVHCGVLHPLQTVVTAGQGVLVLRDITFGIAGDPLSLAWAREIVALLGSRAVVIADDRMPLYHAGAVMAGNAAIAVIDAAARLMEQSGVPYDTALDAIGPLCRAALENALRLGPKAALTGPIARGDVGTVKSHVDALATTPDDVAGLYRSAGKCLLHLARQRGLAHARIQELAVALGLDHKAGDVDGRHSNSDH